MRQASEQVTTFTFLDHSHERIKQTLFMPLDVLSQYQKFKECSLLEAHISTEKLVEIFKENGAFLYGKNAVQQLEGDELIFEEDYDETGNLIEARTYMDGDFNRQLYDKYSSDHTVCIGTRTIPVQPDTLHSLSASLEEKPAVEIYIKFGGEANKIVPKLRLETKEPELDIWNLKLLYMDEQYSVERIETRKGLADEKTRNSLADDINFIVRDPEHMPEYLQTLVDVMTPVSETIKMAKEYKLQYRD